MDLETINRYLAASHMAELASKLGCTNMWSACWQVAAERWDQMTDEERALAKKVQASS